MLSCRSCKNSYCQTVGFSVGLYCRLKKFELLSPDSVCSIQYNQQKDIELKALKESCSSFEEDSSLTMQRMISDLNYRNKKLIKEFEG